MPKHGATKYRDFMPKHGAQNIETLCRNIMLKIIIEITCWKKFRHYAQNAECSYICSRQKRSHM